MTIVHNEEYQKEVAQTILAQLGGRRFIVMTGSKDFRYDEKGLNFKIGKNSFEIHTCLIEYLYKKDLYKMSFYNKKLTLVREFEEIFFDMLQDIFTDVTGLYTHL